MRQNLMIMQLQQQIRDMQLMMQQQPAPLAAAPSSYALQQYTLEPQAQRLRLGDNFLPSSSKAITMPLGEAVFSAKELDSL